MTYALGRFQVSLTLTGSADVSATGNAHANVLLGNAGANHLNGGAGNDVLIWDPLDRHLDGGSGEDTLRLAGAGISLDLTQIANNRIAGIERIDLTGSGDNNLTLSIHDVLALPDHAGVGRCFQNSAIAFRLIDVFIAIHHASRQ